MERSISEFTWPSGTAKDKKSTCSRLSVSEKKRARDERGLVKLKNRPTDRREPGKGYVEVKLGMLGSTISLTQYL